MKKFSQLKFDFAKRKTAKGKTPPLECTQIFSADDMEQRAKRLRAEGKMPLLPDVAKVAYDALQAADDREFLRQVGIAVED